MSVGSLGRLSGWWFPMCSKCESQHMLGYAKCSFCGGVSKAQQKDEFWFGQSEKGGE